MVIITINAFALAPFGFVRNNSNLNDWTDHQTTVRTIKLIKILNNDCCPRESIILKPPYIHEKKNVHVSTFLEKRGSFKTAKHIIIIITDN